MNTHHPRHGGARQHRAAGLTLIELMVAVAIVGVLAAVAYPNYSEHVVRTRRAAAAGCALELAQFMERVYASNLRYDLNGGAATTLPAVQCSTDLSSDYQFAFGVDQPQQRTFSIAAAPQGAQATRDTRCGTLTIDQANARTRSGTAATVAECWR
jgi:type IV pilus assembly protein PilE